MRQGLQEDAKRCLTYKHYAYQGALFYVHRTTVSTIFPASYLALTLINKESVPRSILSRMLSLPQLP
ncbi:hypothetical protein EDB37_103436 [Vibrio crassostreae]|nr:hypothetical protein EDB37_103436 [Vibrio crassostreae]